MEQEIIALFEKVLSRKVDFNDELIESDILDSILAVDLVLEVQDVYGCIIPPTEVANVLKTPATLASYIAENCG
ncbi:acyl carrier protein [Salmonella enterica]|uniref:Acyl carrier protein n=1 Tax=Salmonella enterica subsp. houtenae serovar 45:g,z51:- TaxID=1967611 RepID=A0A736RA15_SALHO|nr:acyl carrier protein [Salmonella enterica]ECG1391790.1 acyl carrier protein [Salmonella enterica subsp. houtenae str. CFSAN000557]EDT6888539.1 acyl carrier protein [Salmonella enterica subsp. enterica]HAE7767571.1 acyl carrier protein [Salmonella enterica subsp. houtenae serovar 45:g,z51:-]ECJ9309718.1 acyl carrier protein [Salmonella enterica]